jgi:TonB family protein
MVAAMLLPAGAQAFCGFYVSGATGEIYNNATQVVMMREGTRTVLSMQNNYEGPPQDFAMVVPVPVVLQKENVKTLDKAIFAKVDQMAAPRLVEYWEKDPCRASRSLDTLSGLGMVGTGRGGGGVNARGMGYGVVVEAQFEVGEYEIVILSAKNSGGLDGWLRAQKYNIPAGAESVLRPYVEAGTKFFVAKVNVKKVQFEGNRMVLSPLRFYYDTKDFTLPIRLGLLNARGHQDVIVHILARNQRYQVANYENVTIPTNLIVDDTVRDGFAEFYAALFDETIAQNPKAVVTEYSWNASSCDPCPGPTLTGSDFMTLGADVVSSTASWKSNPGIRPLPVLRLGKTRVNGPLDRTIILRVVRKYRRDIKNCYQRELLKNPAVQGRIKLRFTIGEKGRVLSARVAQSTLRNKRVEQCFVSKVKRWVFPEPQGAGVVHVAIPFTLSTRGGSSPYLGGFVLTRLHARYTKETLGEDLVFEAAPPIVGGRGTPDQKGQLAEKGSKPGRTNNFQGRYAILHPWDGELACQEPVRGSWGRPPAGKGTETQAARGLANAPRGKAELPMLVRQDVPAIELKTRHPMPPLQSLKRVVPPEPGADTSPPSADASPPGPGANTSLPPPTDASPPAEQGQCGCRLTPWSAELWLPWRRR